MCDFCEMWDWGKCSAKIESGKYASIQSAGGSYRFPIGEQFNFCPVCGCTNPKKAIADKVTKNDL